jgi:hypothetical protein
MVTLLACYALCFGALLLTLAMRLRKLTPQLPPALGRASTQERTA